MGSSPSPESLISAHSNRMAGSPTQWAAPTRNSSYLESARSQEMNIPSDGTDQQSSSDATEAAPTPTQSTAKAQPKSLADRRKEAMQSRLDAQKKQREQADAAIQKRREAAQAAAARRKASVSTSPAPSPAPAPAPAPPSNRRSQPRTPPTPIVQSNPRRR